MTRGRGVAFAKSVIGPCILAWLSLAFGEAIARIMPFGGDFPSLPRVSIPGGAAGDVLSTVPGLFLALTIGLLAALVAEFGKFGAARLQSWRVFWSITAYQLILVFDALRIGANDWWLWLLGWTRIIAPGSVSERPYDSPLPPPWIALAGLLFVAGAALLETRSKERALAKPHDE